LNLPTDFNQTVTLVSGELSLVSDQCVSQFNIINNSTESVYMNSQVIVTIKLKRILFYHLTYTFMPTTSLLIIAEITLQFDESKMELASGLSLTIMLVMYTMYQSITGELITTAYLKMIDYWLLFCLLMPFLIFMLEIYLMLQRNQRMNATTKGWVTDEKLIPKQRKRIQLLAHGLTVTFITVYSLLALLMFFDKV
jgi:hypothetical protein